MKFNTTLTAVIITSVILFFTNQSVIASDFEGNDFVPQNSDINDQYSEFTVRIGDKEIPYEFLYHQDAHLVGLTKEEASQAIKTELDRVISEIKNISKDPKPEEIIYSYELKKRLAKLVVLAHFDFGLQDYFKDLQDINYPINQDDLNNFEFPRIEYQPENDDLIAVINNYPDTDYEKMALENIIFQSDVLFDSGPVGALPRLKVLIEIIQAAQKYITEYPDSEKLDQVKAVLQNAEEIYNGSDSEDYYDASYENTKESRLSNDYQDKTYTIKKNPIEDVLNDKLGHVEIVKNGFLADKIVMMTLVGVLLVAGAGYSVMKSRKKVQK